MLLAAGGIPWGMTIFLSRLVPAVLAALLLAGCISNRTPPPATVARVDLDRYMGRWFVISHIPYFLERGKVASYDTYARQPDGRLTNNFTFREKTLEGPEKTWEGTARIIDPVSNATWKVSFVWPVSVTYKIFALDPNYSWVLSRERRLPPETYAAILADLRARGLPADKLELVPQPLS